MGRSLLLSQDCVEYLKALDSLDIFIEVGNMLDEQTHLIVVRHRRLRIESELKV